MSAANHNEQHWRELAAAFEQRGDDLFLQLCDAHDTIAMLRAELADARLAQMPSSRRKPVRSVKDLHELFDKRRRA